MWFGDKTLAIFDVWSLEHFISGICIGALIPLLYRPKNLLINIPLQHYILWVLCITFGWEVMEHYLETGLAGDAVAHWFQGVEHPLNRMVSDPLLMVLGSLILRTKPYISWPARAISFIWLFTHIFVFKHSMVLHEIFDI